MNNSKVERLIEGTLVREGAGVKLHRYIGVDRSNAYEPFLLFDYFNSADPLDFMAGFPPHPHRGFETITYLFQGSITHEDNKGHKGIIGAGDVQWMTAGSGIIHSEMPVVEAGRLHGLQLWLNLPAAQKMREPRYQEKANNQLPLETQDSGVIIKVIAGTTDSGTQSPITEIATQPLFLDISLPQGKTFEQKIPLNYQSILFVVSGEILLGEQSILANTLASLTAAEVVKLKANQNSQCLLIAAEKLNEPIVRHGPFVMNTQEEITQAVDDFRSGRF